MRQTNMFDGLTTKGSRRHLNRILAKAPDRAIGIIVAELENYDKGFLQIQRRCVIGWRTAKTRVFAQLHKAAGKFPETTHLNPDVDNPEYGDLIYSIRHKPGRGGRSRLKNGGVGVNGWSVFAVPLDKLRWCGDTGSIEDKLPLTQKQQDKVDSAKRQQKKKESKRVRKRKPDPKRVAKRAKNPRKGNPPSMTNLVVHETAALIGKVVAGRPGTTVEAMIEEKHFKNGNRGAVQFRAWLKAVKAVNWKVKDERFTGGQGRVISIKVPKSD